MWLMKGEKLVDGCFCSEKNLLHQSKELEQIQKDLTESNEIIYQEGKEKEKLSKFFYESQTNNRKLEQKLTREIDENH